MALFRIFTQAYPDEVPGLAWDFRVQRKSYVLVYYFGEIVYWGYQKGRLIEEELVGQDADTPYIHLIVVAFILDIFRRSIDRRPNDGLSQEWRMNRTPEITNFDNILE